MMASPVNRSFRLPLRFGAGILLALGVALGIFVLVMRPPAGDFQAMAGFLTITALISAAVVTVAYRVGLLTRAPG